MNRSEIVRADNSEALRTVIERANSGETIQLVPDYVYEGNFQIPEGLSNLRIQGDCNDAERYTIKGNFLLQNTSFCTLTGFKLLGESTQIGILIQNGCHNSVYTVHFHGWKTAVLIDGTFNRMERCEVFDCSRDGVVLTNDNNKLKTNQFTRTVRTIEINGNNNLVKNSDFKEVKRGMTVKGNGNRIKGVRIFSIARQQVGRSAKRSLRRCVGLRVYEGTGNKVKRLLRDNADMVDDDEGEEIYEIVVNGKRARETKITSCTTAKIFFS